jgi:hypothetical protein
MFGFIEWFKSLFKRDKNELYQCLILRQGVLTITLKSLREYSIENYKVDPFEKSNLICELRFKELPLHKVEKKVLLAGSVIHFYETQTNTLTSYKDLYEKISNLKK